MLGYSEPGEIVTCMVEIWPFARFVLETTAVPCFSLSGEKHELLQSGCEYDQLPAKALEMQHSLL